MSRNTDSLTLTNQTLKYAGHVVQVRNLTRVSKYAVKQRWKILVALLGLVVLIGSFVIASEARGDEAPVVLVAGGSILFVLLLLLRKKRTYALVLETSSGSTDLFSTKDSHFVDEVVATIADVMEHQERPVTYTMNIRSATIEDNSVRGDTVMGDKFANVRGSQIKSPGAKLTYINESMLSNALNTVRGDYGDDVRDALRVLANHIQRSKSQEAGELFNSFNEELTRPNSNRTTLKVLWDGLRNSLPEAAKVASSIATITKALMI
jgi:hypothetical protein